MSKIKNGGLDQYGPERFKQQQFRTSGVKGVKRMATRPSLPGLVLGIGLLLAVH